ncbi:MAG: hypothetical protein DHS20C03_26990 [Minwuia thermotolerans]|nr:MAG: hypothetical protein DHS20C03_26990 [Minwuia thermotolerans]
MRRKVVALRRQHSAQPILIEKAGQGLNLVQDLQRERPDDLPRPIGTEPRGDKADRMAAASARIESGEVLLPEDAPWLDTFLHELLAFPNGRHDDQVDSVSQFLNWERKRQDDIPLNAIVETILNPINSLLGHHRW